MAVGGTAVGIALLANVNAPGAGALSILLPTGNDSATQINILEGNIVDSQFGSGGNGGNVSSNTTVGNLMLGVGNGTTYSKSNSGLFGPIVLGGAEGSGNVTQVNILSHNIINPQFSLDGSNVSDNKAISNVAANNGNSSAAEVTSAGATGVGLFGGAIGNGNTTQISVVSGNIVNPQFSLFGDNTSTNVATTNVSMLNGNWSTTAVGSGVGLGTALIGGVTGNGNTQQFALVTSNIVNPQFSFLGKNASHNDATTNLADGNGNHSDAEVQSTAGPGSGILGGVNGNGNAVQSATSSGNIVNEQLRLGNQIWLPGMEVPVEIPGTDILKSVAEQADNVIVATKAAQSAVTGGIAKHTKGALNKALGKKPNPPADSQPEQGEPSGDAPAENGNADE
jgi:hypothetical protein